MFINYEEALAYIYTSYGKGSKQGLPVVRELLQRMGNPHERLSIIHVAGTNGKGSVCAYLHHVLMAAGYRVGVFTSPHLMRYNERLVVDNAPISDEIFAEILSYVRRAAEQAGVLQLSFFEWLTLMAFVYFERQQVDFAIIEVGIGGRMDSTNVITQPLLSVIASIGYDHMDILGDTLEQIAWEKAGIIKAHRPVTLYPTSSFPVFEAEARQKNAPLYYIGESLVLPAPSYHLDYTAFSVETPYFSYDALKIRLLGEQQVYNAVHALLSVHALRETGVTIAEAAVRTGLYTAAWPGRFELVSDSPVIVLDGAHNEDGAAYFRKALDIYFSNAYIILVVGVLRHKDCDPMLRHIVPRANEIICTRPVSYKALSAEALAAHITQVSCPVTVESDCAAAMAKAVEAAGAHGVVAVTGSLYLVGDVKQHYLSLRGKEK